MSYPINYPTPQGADIQIFSSRTNDWVKPQGASFIWFTLIGPGGDGGSGGGGGGSGAVTNCLVPAFLIPDTLRVTIDSSTTSVLYQVKNTTGYTILTADGGEVGAALGGAGGTAATSNFFAAAGFFQSVAGQNGADADTSNGVSSTTFLSGGSGGNSVTGQGQDSSANYGYVAKGGAAGAANPGGNGTFMLSPVIVGLSGAGGAGFAGAGGNGGKGGVGCGGGGGANTAGNGGAGGPGLVIIISW